MLEVSSYKGGGGYFFSAFLSGKSEKSFSKVILEFALDWGLGRELSLGQKVGVLVYSVILILLEWTLVLF